MKQLVTPRVSTLAAWQEDWETLDASASKATKALEKTREEADKIDELKKEKDEEWVPKKCRWTEMMCIPSIPPKMNNRMKGRGFGKKTLMSIVGFSTTLQEFHGEIGDVTMKVYGEEMPSK